MCLGAIYWARINKIYYANNQSDAAAIGFDDQFIYEELDRPKEQRKLPVIEMLRDEALGAFRAWETSVAKTHY